MLFLPKEFFSKNFGVLGDSYGARQNLLGPSFSVSKWIAGLGGECPDFLASTSRGGWVGLPKNTFAIIVSYV